MFSQLSKTAIEIENSLFQELKSFEEEKDLSALEEISAEQRLDNTLGLLVQAAEGFENLGLDEEAEKTQALIEDLAGISTVIDDYSIVVKAREELDIWLKEAAKKKTSPKSKKPSKKPAKKSPKLTKTTKKTTKKDKEKINGHMKDLTPEKAIQNLKEFGWIFNMDPSEKDNCMMCDETDKKDLEEHNEFSDVFKKNDDYGWIDEEKADDYNWLDE